MWLVMWFKLKDDFKILAVTQLDASMFLLLY